MEALQKQNECQTYENISILPSLFFFAMFLAKAESWSIVWKFEKLLNFFWMFVNYTIKCFFLLSCFVRSNSLPNAMKPFLKEFRFNFYLKRFQWICTEVLVIIWWSLKWYRLQLNESISVWYQSDSTYIFNHDFIIQEIKIILIASQAP